MFGIKINNFRSLSGTQFDFSKINILIGENSSGKSSLIKFLLFLKRSIKFNSTSFRYTSELGRFDDLVYIHNDKLQVSFELKFGEDYIKFFLGEIGQISPNNAWKEISKKISNLKGEDKIVKLSFAFDKNIQISNLVSTTIENSYFGKIELKRNEKGNDSVIQGNWCTLEYKSNFRKKKIKLEKISFDQHGFLTITNGSSIKSLIEGDKEISDSIFREIAFLLISQNYTQLILNKITYLNPISSTPERAYDENEIQGKIYPIKDIKDVVNILSDKTLTNQLRKRLLSKLNAALKFYGILYELKVISSEFGPKELRVKVNENGIWSNIKDVGYGSALQIPILFQTIIGQDFGGQTIVIEQPELHIHPFLQARFIETLLKIGNKNSFIIETHSGDIVRKLQVMVKKGVNDLKPNNVNIYYFKKPENISEISKHNINENGKLTPKFPTGFYDTSINLVKELF